MERLSGAMLRLALAVPLEHEVYRLATFSARASNWSLDSLLVNRGLLLLPAVGLVLGCILLIAWSRARWVWLAVAASGCYLVFVDVYPYAVLSGESWRPSVESAVGLYAFLLALAILLKRGGRAGAALEG